AEGPGAGTALGVSVPEAQDMVAASARSALRSTSGRRNLALPARSLAKVRASAACFLVRVDALEPSFKTCDANPAVDFPAALALAVNAPGRFTTSSRGFPKSVPFDAMRRLLLLFTVAGAAGGRGRGRPCSGSSRRGPGRAAPAGGCRARPWPGRGRRYAAAPVLRGGPSGARGTRRAH